MAGHCPIKTTEKHIVMLTELLSNNNVDEMKDFQTDRKEFPRWIKLSREYSMSEFDTLPEEDVYIVAFQGEFDIFEFHLNKDKKIIQIYLVL